MKIEIRKPQYEAHKHKAVAEVHGRAASQPTPFFFQLLLLGTYACSALALWFVFQRIRAI